MTFSIRNHGRRIYAGVGFLILVFVAAGTLSSVLDERRLTESVKKDASNLARLLLEHADQIVAVVEESLNRAADQLDKSSRRDLTEEERRSVFKDLPQHLPAIAFHFLYDVDEHRSWMSNSKLALPDLSSLKVDGHALSLSLVPAEGVIGGHWVVVSRVVTRRDGRRWLVGSALDPDFFLNFYRDLTDRGEPRISLRLLSGPILLRFPVRGDLVGRNFFDQQKVYKEVAVNRAGHVYDRSPMQLDEAMYTYRRSPRYPFFVVLVYNLDRLYGSWRLTSLLGGAMVALASIVLIWLARRWVRQLEWLGREDARLREWEDRAVRGGGRAIIGRLAAGLSKDLNDVLTSMFGLADRLARRLDPHVPAAESVAKIQGVLIRAREMVWHVLVDKIKGVMNRPDRVNLATLVDDVAQTLKAGLPAGVTVVTELGPCPLIAGASVQVYQVLLNLCTNALDAMKTSGGRLTLRTRTAADGGAICEVEDTGVGIAEKDLRRIFESGFTTKSEAGHGLGLPFVRELVHLQGATMNVQSVPGQGSRFEVHWPAGDVNA